MPYIPKSLRTSLRLVYSQSDRNDEGLLTELPGKLAMALTFDRFGLSQLPSSKKVTLWFRSGMKRVFHVRLIRRGGRFLVEMGGGDPTQVLRGVQICKAHFDEAFGITSDDIRSTSGLDGTP